VDEFGLIAACFKPLSKGYSGSLNLTDDAAIVSLPAGQELVVTTDAISAGVHFLGNEEPALIARKLLRCNLSDLAAKGAAPLAYFLNVMLPTDTTPEWVHGFADGLRQDQAEYSIHLAGGDTIATKGPATFSMTALGVIPAGKMLRRCSARPGDIIVVSGTLGDSALGLISLRGAAGDEYLINRYLLPEPRLALGKKLLGLANASMDISDGLVQDLGHICEESKVGATIRRPLLPLSKPAAAMIKNDEKLWDKIVGGGDDYELLFTVPASKKQEIGALAAKLDLPLTVIGEIIVGDSVQLLDENNKTVPLANKGYRHF